jgi:hypothetical protein
MDGGEIMDRFLIVQRFRCGELLKWEPQQFPNEE